MNGWYSLGTVFLAASVLFEFEGASGALPCNSTVCRPPDCNCASTRIPGGLPAHQTPQVVTIVVNGDIREQEYAFYRDILGGVNPNGCPYTATFLVSHNSTNYEVVEGLYSQGNEIGDNTVTRRPSEDYWLEIPVDQWIREIEDEREIINYWANVPAESVVGFQAPYLLTDDNELQALYDLRGFLYDASMFSEVMYWPFTLDYQSPLCRFPNTCPTKSYPGLWIVPAIEMIKGDGGRCVTLPACKNETVSSPSEWYNLIMSNFKRHYDGNRAPFGLYFDLQIFYDEYANILHALLGFLDELRTFQDVYFVSLTQLIEWVREPTSLTNIKEFPPWLCPKRPSPRCTPGTQTTCGPYQVHGGPDRLFSSCVQTCPPNYPNIGNPKGQ